MNHRDVAFTHQSVSQCRDYTNSRPNRSTAGVRNRYQPSTLERYEHAFYRPLVSNWQNYENWQIAGGRDATQRASDIWKKSLKEYVEPAVDPAIREALDTYVERRRTEIGSEEP